MARQTLTSIRLPQDLLDRADALIPRLQGSPLMAAVGSVNRATVLRVAVALGLEALGGQVQHAAAQLGTRARPSRRSGRKR